MLFLIFFFSNTKGKYLKIILKEICLFINLLYHIDLSFSSANVKIKNNKSEKINTVISMIQLII